MSEGIEAVKAFLAAHPVFYAATTGLDKKPDIHPVRLCYEAEGALYFAAAKCETFYGELSLRPAVKLCAFDADQGVTLNIRGTAVFTEDEDVIARCMEKCGPLKERWGREPRMLIAWFLKDTVCEFVSEKDGSSRTIELGTPGGALTGIEIRKDKELRDRLISIMAERESTVIAAADEHELFLQKLYDGALLYFAETAKALWPRMDIGPIERSAMFETYDEREHYTGLARKAIGNKVIDKPEDMTYWLNQETLGDLVQR